MKKAPSFKGRSSRALVQAEDLEVDDASNVDDGRQENWEEVRLPDGSLWSGAKAVKSAGGVQWQLCEGAAASSASSDAAATLPDHLLPWKSVSPGSGLQLHVGPHVARKFRPELESRRKTSTPAGKEEGRPATTTTTTTTTTTSSLSLDSHAPGAAVLILASAGSKREVFIVSGCNVDTDPQETRLLSRTQRKQESSGIFGGLWRALRRKSESLPDVGDENGDAKENEAVVALRSDTPQGKINLFIRFPTPQAKAAWVEWLTRAASYNGLLVSTALERLQPRFRMILARRQFFRERAAAQTLQLAVRAASARLKATRHRQQLATIILQRAARTALAVQTVRREYKQALARRKILAEIVATEKSYSYNIWLFHEIFYLRIRKTNSREDGGVVPHEVLKDMFPKIADLVKCHQRLSYELEQSVSTSPCNARVAELFLKYAPEMMASLPTFVAGASDACQRLREYARGGVDTVLPSTPKSPDKGKVRGLQDELQQLLDGITRDPRAQQKDLESLVIQPAQRVPRYEMLLADLAKHVPVGHPMTAKLHEARSTLADIATEVNEQMRVRSSRSRLQRLDNRTKQRSPRQVDLKSSNMAIVREGTVLAQKVSKGGKVKWKSTHMILFSDCLVCAKADTVRKRNLATTTKFEFQKVLDLVALTYQINDAQEGAAWLASFQSSDVTVLISFETERERKSWLEALAKAQVYAAKSAGR